MKKKRIIMQGRISLWVLSLLVVFVGTTSTAVAQSETPADEADPQARPARLGDSLSVDPGQEWTPGQQSPADRQDELRRKLALGKNALDAGNLLAPFDASALNYFRQALAIDPENSEADTGLNQLADRLLERAAEQFSLGNLQSARDTAATVAGFRPGYPPLNALRTRFSEQNQLSGLLVEADAAVQAGALLMPLESSALGYFDQMLGINSQHPEALLGLQNLITTVRTSIDEAIGSGDFDGAAQQLDLAESAFAQATHSLIGPEPPLQGLREVLVSSRAQQWQSNLAAAEQMLASNQLDAARAELTTLESSGYPGDLTRLRSQIERRAELMSYQPGSVFADNLRGGGDGPLLVVIPAGQFQMGSPAGEEGGTERERPLTEITFAAPFAMARSEVTVAQFAAFVAATGYQTTAEGGRRGQHHDLGTGGFKEASVSWRQDFVGDDAQGELPVTHVSWVDAQAYASWLSEASGKTYRLPSESEFEYAHRAGSETPYWWGEDSPDEPLENLTGSRDELQGLTWPDSFSRYGDGYWGPAPAGSFKPNPWNVFDLGGNLLEWAGDCFQDTLRDIPTDGRARQIRPCSVRSLRGGGWAVSPTMARAASRASAQAERSSPLIGFRVVREL